MRNFSEKGLIWPLIIVLLLLGSVATMGTFIFMANSDGGAIVVEGYYDKAVRWDSLSSARIELSRRNWLPSLKIDQAPGVDQHSGALTLFDSMGTKITGLTGNVAMNQPHLNPGTERIKLDFFPSDSTYSFEFGAVQGGLWDFVFIVRDAQSEMEFKLRKTLK